MSKASKDKAVSAKPRRDEHAVRITTRQTAIAKKLADQQNRAFADVLSDAVGLGLDALIERDNRANIWIKTSAKAEIVMLLESIPEDKLNDAIEALKNL